MPQSKVQVRGEQIADFCRHHHIQRLALFGSVLRADFRPDSDIDVLVEFEPGCTPGFAFFRIQDDLATLLGRTVDLHTAGFLGQEIRDRVLQEAETVYVAT